MDETILALERQVAVLKRENAKLQRTSLSAPIHPKDASSSPKDPSSQKSGTKSPSWTATSWLMSLKLVEILSAGLTKGKQKDQQEASFIRDDMSEDDMRAAFRNVSSEMEECLVKDHRKLKKQDEVDATALNDKFSAAEGSFTFTYGGQVKMNL